MTSALHRSPSQARREVRRFEVLKAQRRRLLLALERADSMADPWADVKLRAEVGLAIDEVRACRVVPLEDA